MEFRLLFCCLRPLHQTFERSLRYTHILNSFRFQWEVGGESKWICVNPCDTPWGHLCTLPTEKRTCPCILAQAQRCTGALVEGGSHLRRPPVAIWVKGAYGWLMCRNYVMFTGMLCCTQLSLPSFLPPSHCPLDHIKCSVGRSLYPCTVAILLRGDGVTGVLGLVHPRNAYSM